MVMWFACVIWEEFFLKKILHKAAQRPITVHFFPYEQVSGRNGDHDWLRMTNTFILCDLVWKVQKSHAANREGSFNGCMRPYNTHWDTPHQTWPAILCDINEIPNHAIHPKAFIIHFSCTFIHTHMNALLGEAWVVKVITGDRWYILKQHHLSLVICMMLSKCGMIYDHLRLRLKVEATGVPTPKAETEGRSHRCSYATPHKVITTYGLPDKGCFAFI